MPYNGISNLRGKSDICEYTKDQLTELVTCANDPNYFISKYVKIETSMISPIGECEFKQPYICEFIDQGDTNAI